MSIEIFTFLEKNKTEILEELKSRLKSDRPAYNEMSDSTLQLLLEQLHEGYLDYLITDESDNLDILFRALARVLTVRGARFSDVFDVPLTMASVIRHQLAAEFSDLEGNEGIEKLNEALDKTDATAHKTACRFLDVFQEHLKKRIDDHNNYLARTQHESGIDLSSFKIEPV